MQVEAQAPQYFFRNSISYSSTSKGAKYTLSFLRRHVGDCRPLGQSLGDYLKKKKPDKLHRSLKSRISENYKEDPLDEIAVLRNEFLKTNLERNH